MPQVFQEAYSSQRISLRVQGRAEGADACPSRDRRQDAPSHTAFGGQPHPDSELPRTIVETAGGHERPGHQGVTLREHPLPRDGVFAPRSQCHADHRQISGGAPEGALAEVGIQDVFHISSKSSHAAHEVRQGAVAIAGGFFREICGVVAVQGVVPREPPSPIADEGEPLLRVLVGKQGEDHQSSRVDEGILGTVGFDHFQPHDGVEGVCGGVHAHGVKDPGFPQELQRPHERNGLGDGLEGEKFVRIARSDHRAVRSGEGHPEMAGIAFGEFGNVGGYFALADSGTTDVDRLLEQGCRR